MTLSLRPQLTGIIEMIPSLPIHSSVLIPLVAGLFLAALILRAQRLPKQAERRNQGLTTRQARTARRYVYRSRGLRGAGRDNKGTQMSRINAEDTTQGNPGKSARNSDGFRIYWGRSILAAVTLIAMIGGIGTAVAAPFLTGLTWVVPAVFAAVLLTSLASLRVSAVVRRRAGRRERVERAMRQAMNPEPQATRHKPETVQSEVEPSAAEGSPRVAARRFTGPFDALSADESGKGGPDSLVTIDADGLPESADRLFGPEGSPRQVADQESSPVRSGPGSAEPWEVRSVPAAHYMVAAKAERPEPEPLNEPAPVPSSEVKLKPSAASPESPEVNPAPQQAINLDKVLQRRRA
ncbi:hypothetical protein [Nesterenkonia natronophila]|nr:hypothetical protein [Nesterenkonia natronophila]